MIRQVLALTLMLAGICFPCAASSFLQPVVTVSIPHGSSNLVSIAEVVGGSPAMVSIQGLLKQPVAVPHFVSFRNKGLPTQRTEVRLTHDANYLYVVFTCYADDTTRLLTACAKHDGPVWRDDSVEIFLDPDNDGKNCYHLIANAVGTQYDEYGRLGTPESWDGPWYTMSRIEEKAWHLSAAIPFSSLGLETPKSGDVWGVNLGRNERVRGEISSWSPVLGEFAEPQYFGRIVFSRELKPVINATLPDVGAPGRYSATAEISNPGRSPITIRAEMLVDGKPLQGAKTSVYNAPAGRSDWSFGIDYPLEGPHKISLQFTDAEGRVVSRTAPLLVDVPPHSSRLNRFRRIVRELGALGDVSTYRRRLSGLEAFERTARSSRGKWAEFGRRLDGIEAEITRLRCQLADPQGKGYCIGTESSLKKILRHEFFDGEIGQPVRISVARNEFESAQGVVIAHEAALERVEVAVSTLTGPGGAVLPAPALNLVGYVQTRKPKYDVDYVGWWPDPLMPVEPFDVAEGGMQPLWITVRPSEETPAGVYKGTITVRPGNTPESSLPIEVRVWDFTLPVEPHLRTAFALFEHEIGAWYGGMTEDIKRNYYACMLEHRLSVMNLYSKQPIPCKEDMPYCFDRGQNFLTLAYTHNRDRKGRDELASMIREHEAFMRPKGWWDKACIYGFDEIRPDKYHELRDMYRWLGKEFPDLPRMCTVAPTEELKGSVDIWVPLTSNYMEKDAREFEKAGDQVWWYVCCVPYHPYPNFFIDYPAVDQRLVFWMNWKYRIPGFLYYAVNHWLTNRTAHGLPEEHRSFDDPADIEALKSGKRWPEIKWNTFTFDNYNGDGHLIYPGPDGKPVSSIRLECIRDGIEDYDYFAILDGLVKSVGADTDKTLLDQARKLLAISNEIIASPCDYTLDRTAILNTRQQVAEAIENLSK